MIDLINFCVKFPSSQITPLPRKKTLSFPVGATYYGESEAAPKPRDYTLNIPQQTYFLVPAPAPGKNRLVSQNVGNYGAEAPRYIDHYPTKPLQSQYAPVYDQEGAEEYHVGAPYEEEEMMPVEPPKEQKKRRKTRKQKKQKAAETESEDSTNSPFES